MSRDTKRVYVLTLIRRPGTPARTLAEFAEILNALQPAISFVQTYPDELQGGIESAATAIRCMLLAAQGAEFWVGLGVGELKAPRFAAALGVTTIPECTGDVISYSRIAVEQARTGSPARGVVILGADRSFSEQATGSARLLYRVASARTTAENRVINLMVPGVRGQQKEAAAALGISSQAVSKTLVRSMYHEQEAAIPALAELLVRLDS